MHTSDDLPKRHMQTLFYCAAFFLSALTLWAIPENSPASLALSPLATPTLTPSSTVAPAKDEMLIFVRPNGDVVLYSLADQRATLLLEQAYHYGNGENPHFYPISTPLRPSPDGKWLLIPTPDQGTWLAALDGSMQRQISERRLSATWAPDSQQISYVVVETGPEPPRTEAVLYTQNIIQEHAPRALLTLPGVLAYPSWSPGCDQTAPTTHSCGQHIFVLNIQDDQTGYEPWQALVVETTTGTVTQLGPYVPPAREISIGEFQWSPAGNEVWLPSGYPTAFNAIAMQMDGSPARPLVGDCRYSNCQREAWHSGLNTSNGWSVAFVPNGRNMDISAKNAAGEEIEIAKEAFLIDTLASLRSTEVGVAATLVPLPGPGDVSLWNQRHMRQVGLYYRTPLAWDEALGQIENYRLAGSNGMVSLGDEQLHITLSTGPFRDLELLDLDEDFDVWIEKWAASQEPLEGEWGSLFMDSYSRDRYQFTGKIVRVDNRPAVRLQSAIDPFIQLIVVPMKWHNLVISIWSSNVEHEAVIEEILASIILPSPAGEAGGTNITALRSGPGHNYPSFGELDIGDVVEVVARNEIGDWLQLRRGLWVEAQYLTGATASLPVAHVPQTPTPTPISASPLAIP